MTTNFEPQECVIFVQSTKIGTNENKAIHSSSVYSKCRNFREGLFSCFGGILHLWQMIPPSEKIKPWHSYEGILV